MENNKFNIMIGIPAASHVENECIESVFKATMVADKRINSYKLVLQRSYLIDDNRNALAKRAVDIKADYLVMVDSDTVIPEASISRMLDIFQVDSSIKMVCGWQIRKRNHNGETETFIEDGNKDYIKRYTAKELEEISLKSDGIEIKGTGFGLVMIDVSVIKEMLDQKLIPFKYVVYDPFIPGQRLSEDNYFCSLVKRTLKYKIICVTKLKCGHIWKEEY